MQKHSLERVNMIQKGIVFHGRNLDFILKVKGKPMKDCNISRPAISKDFSRMENRLEGGTNNETEGCCYNKRETGGRRRQPWSSERRKTLK